MKVFLNASEIAKLMRVNRATVTRWAQHGLLKGAIRVDDGHQWRIPLSTYEELIKKRKQ
jgi:excisionase family DNA binding protein